MIPVSTFQIEDVSFNTILCTRVLWCAIQEYQNAINQEMPLQLINLVLPIVMHKRSRIMIYKMNIADGTLPKAIGKIGHDRTLVTGNDLFLGLSGRIEYMSFLTLKCLALGISSGLLYRVSTSNNGFPAFGCIIKKLPNTLAAVTGDESDQQIKASRRLGAWFARTAPHELYHTLKVGA